MKVVIQPGIYQGPIQAFTALCSTNGVFGVKMREINSQIFIPNTPVIKWL